MEKGTVSRQSISADEQAIMERGVVSFLILILAYVEILKNKQIKTFLAEV